MCLGRWCFPTKSRALHNSLVEHPTISTAEAHACRTAWCSCHSGACAFATRFQDPPVNLNEPITLEWDNDQLTSSFGFIWCVFCWWMWGYITSLDFLRYLHLKSIEYMGMFHFWLCISMRFVAWSCMSCDDKSWSSTWIPVAEKTG